MQLYPMYYELRGLRMIYRALMFLFIFVISFYINSAASERGYGDWPLAHPGHPNMRERRILVLTNACRISPTQYRDNLLVPHNSMASSILLPENYPPVEPLYWQVDLNRVAKVHAVDMANKHGLSHTSSDGTTFQNRVPAYYKKSQRISENIACGSKSAFGSMRQWLLDIIDTIGTPAPDKSSDDGHRRNIMNSRSKELGCGYAKGPIRWYYFWVQDFGGGTPDYSNPISAGAHFVHSGNNTEFMCVYSDPQGNEPKVPILNLDGNEHTLAVKFGSKNKGTYALTLPSASDCRYYYFSFTDSNNKNWRHPEHGRLVTVGEGSCEEEYEAPGAISYRPCNKSLNHPHVSVQSISNNRISINIEGPPKESYQLSIINFRGQRIYRQMLDNTQKNVYIGHTLSPGIYHVHLCKKGKPIASTMFVHLLQ